MKKLVLLAFSTLFLAACSSSIDVDDKKVVTTEIEAKTVETEKISEEEASDIIDAVKIEPATVISKTEPTMTESGLKIEILNAGAGVAAKNGDMVTVHYTGTLEDGTKFDSSVDRGTPFSFELGAGKVIKGWEEGVAGMMPGEKRKLTIPSDLAYGERALPGIPAGSTLLFDVELIKAEKLAELEITDVLEGSGNEAVAGSFVEMHYTGTLEDGTVFDSSVERGTPFRFTLGVGQVIPGWDQGIVGMKPGGKRTLVIPAHLAYGSRQRGAIPANSTLKFEVEFLGFVTPDFLKKS